MRFISVIPKLILQQQKNAGVDGIIVSWGFREKEILIQNGAECIVDTSQELVDKILG